MSPPKTRSTECSCSVAPSLGNNIEPHSSPATPQQLFQLIKRRILEAKGSGYVEYQQIPPETGQSVARRLTEDGDIERANPTLSYNTLDRVFSVTISSATHGSACPWVSTEMIHSGRQGLFTMEEDKDLIKGGNGGFYNFPAPWAAGSYKEPDVYIIHPATFLPTVVIESGYYNESSTKLQYDKDLWLLGGAPHVNVVILIKWDKEADSNRVSGWIELHRRGDSGTAIRKKRLLPGG
ncbi:hypothetical protein AbraIFM66951_000018 [Aspergillus brasiliensis]|uniref:Uncharacterized protein n=1 Tax=Aspergillus brasiliensis TaxID=319629 RepID=A0A9W5YW34_9EURO|nr:hypothetical protein AbraCBS73388_009457 [Aspergillus brasiliensis]GKZ40258.1 hypothetical protein AbraIFM66951_000018 [Aspergillus brasiliensis]